MGRLRPKVHVLSLLDTILIKKAPLSCTFLLKRVTPRENERTLIFSWLLLSHTYFFNEHCIPFRNLRFRPALVSDFISLATSFLKYKRFPRQITTFEASRKRSPLVSDSREVVYECVAKLVLSRNLMYNSVPSSLILCHHALVDKDDFSS